ncbi:MAG: molybdate ABC transporter permease subunit [Pseudomonadota bacterium]
MNWTLTPAEWTALALSLKVAFWCTVASLLPAIAVAWLLARREFPGKAAFDALVHLPMVLPPVVPGYLLLLLFGHQGALGGWLHDSFGISFVFDWKGAVLASAVMGFPLLVQPIRLALQMIDRRLENAARTLGASPFDTFRTITLPLALPGVLIGALLAFSRSLGEFGATITFVGNIEGETRTLPLAIYSSLHVPDGDAMALRLVTLSIVIAFLSLLASNWLSRRATQRLGYERHADA